MVADTVRWYRSKVDWWMVPLLCLPPVALVVACIALALAGKTSELPLCVAILLLLAGIYFGLVCPMRYGLDDTHLVVRFGLCRQRIPLADISEVHRTRKGFCKAVMISPADRNGFLDDLARTAGLKREGDRLVRA
jgi:hypothetical protein